MGNAEAGEEAPAVPWVNYAARVKLGMPADPAWAPDARHLAFRMEFKREYDIWRLSQFLPR